MKINDLDLRSLLSFDPKGGIIKFMGQRVLLFDPVVMGVLRRELINSLGASVARNILTRLGYAHGWLTAHNLGSEYPDLLQNPMAGPILHTLQGVVNFKEMQIEGHYLDSHFTVTWENSYEAEQHLLQLGLSSEPVCWGLTGYVSGYVSRMHGQEIYCIEHRCVGKGDPVCFAESRPREDWGETINDQLSFFQEETMDGVLKDVTAKLRKAEKRLSQLQKLVDTDIYPSGIIASSIAMRHVLSMAKRIAQVDSSVIVMGETGVGKELVARHIHDESARARRPFIAVNCGAVTETLLESEFFGHIRGAFTGADRDRIGLFEAANGGTIFLDEVGEMPLDMQAKLLRALQQKKIRRVGETKSRPVDFRVIAATNRNLKEEVERGRFRSDLYYRLCVIELDVPPLRDRTEDILPMARFFLDKTSERMKRSVNGFSPGAVEHLLFYDWPGNVRELDNVIERAVALCPGDTINVDDLPHGLRKGIPTPCDHEDIRALGEIERKCILTALEMTKGDKRLAAEKLGIGLRTLYRKLKEYRQLDAGAR